MFTHRTTVHSSTPLICDKCDTGKEWKDFLALHNHFYRNHIRGEFVCAAEQCGFVGGARGVVKNHFELHHREPAQPANESTPVVCAEAQIKQTKDHSTY